MKSKTASNIAIYIALALFFLSWCLPVGREEVGFLFMLHAVFAHILIIPIIKAFPVWANFTFLWALRYHFDQDISPKLRSEKVFFYAQVTIACMFFGMLMRMDEIRIGVLVWLISGLFLICGLSIQKLTAVRAYFILSGLIFSVVIFSFLLYQHEKENIAYQTQYKESDWHHVFFKGKDTDAKVYKESKEIHSFEDEKGSVFSVKDLDISDIEVKFNPLFPPLEKYSTTPTDCDLAPNQQHFIHYPLDYVEDGYQWRQYFVSGSVSVGYPTEKTGKIIYQAQNIDEKYTELKIFRRDTQQILYEQRLLRNVDSSRYVDGRNCYYEPRANLFLEKVFADGKDINVKAYAVAGQFAQSETLQPTCTWKELSRNKYEFEGKRINFMDERMDAPQMLCSESYMAVVYIDRNDRGNFKSLRSQVFQRSDLQPIACGVLSYLFEDKDLKQLYEKTVQVEQLQIKEIPTDQDCPYVEILLNNGAIEKDRNFSYKNPI